MAEQLEQASATEVSLRAEIASYQRRIEGLGASMASSLAASSDGTAGGGGGGGGDDGEQGGGSEVEAKVRELEVALETARIESGEAAALREEQQSAWCSEREELQAGLEGLRGKLAKAEDEVSEHAALRAERDALEADLRAVRGQLVREEADHTALQARLAEVEADLAAVKLREEAVSQGGLKAAEWEKERGVHLERERAREDEMTRLEKRLREAEAERAGSEAALEAVSLKVADLEEALEACQLDLEIAKEELDALKASAEGRVREGGEDAIAGGGSRVIGEGWGGVEADAAASGERVKVLTEALQRLHALHVSTTSQLESDLDLALEEAEAAEELRSELQRVREQCLGLQQQVDEADGVAETVADVALKCGELEDEVARQSAALAELEEMVQVSSEVEELLQLELQELRRDVAQRDAELSRSEAALLLLQVLQKSDITDKRALLTAKEP